MYSYLVHGTCTHTVLCNLWHACIITWSVLFILYFFHIFCGLVYIPICLFLIPAANFAVNIVDSLSVDCLIPPNHVICIVILHIPLGIATFSFHCTSCMCVFVWQFPFLNLVLSCWTQSQALSVSLLQPVPLPLPLLQSPTILKRFDQHSDFRSSLLFNMIWRGGASFFL